MNKSDSFSPLKNKFIQMKNVKSTMAFLFLLGMIGFIGCSPSGKESDAATDYTDTVESAAPLQDNNTRNDQAADELTKKDTTIQDTFKTK
ncbi:hypothetical protein [Olivibacter ginsenosidimutans]